MSSPVRTTSKDSISKTKTLTSSKNKNLDLFQEALSHNVDRLKDIDYRTSQFQTR